MINSYIDLYRKQKNISIGKLTTAYPVAPEVVERIRKIVVSRTKGTAEFATKETPPWKVVSYSKSVPTVWMQALPTRYAE